MKLKYLPALVAAAMLSAACVLETPSPNIQPTTEVPAQTPPAGTSAASSGGPVKQFVESGGVRIPQYPNVPPVSIDVTAKYTATIRTNLGSIVVELFADSVPITVNNFIFLANDGFYNGLIFHRVIPSFMIQGGDPTGTGFRGPGYQFQDEFVAGLTFDQPGRLAMANSGPGTNGSQFFVTTVPTPNLSGVHTIFGQVIQGQDVVENISRTRADPQDRPVVPVVIQGIEITKNP